MMMLFVQKLISADIKKTKASAVSGRVEKFSPAFIFSHDDLPHDCSRLCSGSGANNVKLNDN